MMYLGRSVRSLVYTLRAGRRPQPVAVRGRGCRLPVCGSFVPGPAAVAGVRGCACGDASRAVRRPDGVRDTHTVHPMPALALESTQFYILGRLITRRKNAASEECTSSTRTAAGGQVEQVR